MTLSSWSCTRARTWSTGGATLKIYEGSFVAHSEWNAHVMVIKIIHSSLCAEPTADEYIIIKLGFQTNFLLKKLIIKRKIFLNRFDIFRSGYILFNSNQIDQSKRVRDFRTFGYRKTIYSFLTML